MPTLMIARLGVYALIAALILSVGTLVLMITSSVFEEYKELDVEVQKDLVDLNFKE